jgi:hypothetical protein
MLGKLKEILALFSFGICLNIFCPFFLSLEDCCKKNIKKEFLLPNDFEPWLIRQF